MKGFLKSERWPDFGQFQTSRHAERPMHYLNKNKRGFIAAIALCFSLTSCSIKTDLSCNLIDANDLSLIDTSDLSLATGLNKKIGIVVPLKLTKAGRHQDIRQVWRGVEYTTYYNYELVSTNSWETRELYSKIKDINPDNIELILFSDDLVISVENENVYQLDAQGKGLLIQNVSYIDGRIIWKNNWKEVLLELPDEYDYFIKIKEKHLINKPFTSVMAMCLCGVIPIFERHKFIYYLSVFNKKEITIKSFESGCSANAYGTIWRHPDVINIRSADVKEKITVNLLQAFFQELNQYGEIRSD